MTWACGAAKFSLEQEEEGQVGTIRVPERPNRPLDQRITWGYQTPVLERVGVGPAFFIWLKLENIK